MECTLCHTHGCPISQHMLGCGKRQLMLAYEVPCTAVLGERPRLPLAAVFCIHGILPRLPLLLLEPCGSHGLVARGGVNARRQDLSRRHPCGGGRLAGAGGGGGGRAAACMLRWLAALIKEHAAACMAAEGQGGGCEARATLERAAALTLLPPHGHTLLSRMSSAIGTPAARLSGGCMETCQLGAAVLVCRIRVSGAAPFNVRRSRRALG